MYSYGITHGQLQDWNPIQKAFHITSYWQVEWMRWLCICLLSELAIVQMISKRNWFIVQSRSRNRSNKMLTLPVLRLLLPNHKDAKPFENHSNPVMLVFIGEPSLSTFKWVPMCHDFNHFSGFLHHFIIPNLPTSSRRVNGTTVACCTV